MANEGTVSVRLVGFGGIGSGVFWYVWGKLGFGWALVYGFFWPIWLGYHLAAKLLP